MTSKSNRFQRGGNRTGDEGGRVEVVEREVRSADPSISPEANELLTRELRDAVGQDRVEIPADTPDHRRSRHAGHNSFTASLAANRGLIGITFLAALIAGSASALATGEPWVLLIPLALHAIGTFIVTSGTIQMSTETEHVSPATAARLEEEGVADPDRALTDLVQEFGGGRQGDEALEVVSGGDNEADTYGEEDPAEAAQEQRSAMTPSGSRSRPSGSGSVVSSLPYWVVGGATVLSIVAAILVGGPSWVIPALVIPCALGFLYVERRLDGRREERHPGEHRSTHAQQDARGSAARMIPVIAMLVGATVIGVALLLIASEGL